MSPDLALFAGIAVAILGGAAVGVERQWSGHASGPDARLGGIRTFTFLGALAGISGGLTGQGYPLPAALLVAGAMALIVVSYIRASRSDIEATTEVAALVVLGAGVLGGLGHFQLSAALTTLTVLFLAEKPRLHSLVARLDDATLLAAARFAVMSAVILPLLPEKGRSARRPASGRASYGSSCCCSRASASSVSSRSVSRAPQAIR